MDKDKKEDNDNFFDQLKSKFNFSISGSASSFFTFDTEIKGSFKTEEDEEDKGNHKKQN